MNPWRYAYDPDDKHGAVITVPRDQRLEDRGRRAHWPINLPLDLVDGLTQFEPEVTHAFLILSLWTHKGEEVSEERYLREVAQSDDPADLWPLGKLTKCGLIITPEESKKRSNDWEELIYGTDDGELRSAKPKKMKKVAPEPFPAFLGDRWSGTRETLAETTPRPKIAVVYRLFDELGGLLYIGSSDHLYARLRQHNDKDWVSYEAAECADREAAYWLEAEQIIQHRPPEQPI